MIDFFRKSLKPVFEALYDSLDEQAANDHASARRNHYRPALGLGLEIALPIANTAAASANASYQADEGDDPAAAHKVDPLNPALIAAVIGISSGLSLDEVSALRRIFSAQNHPDKMPAHMREIANQRMIIANRLFDDYRKLKKNEIRPADDFCRFDKIE